MKNPLHVIFALTCQFGLLSCNMGNNSDINNSSINGQWSQLNSTSSGYMDDGSVYHLSYFNNKLYLVNDIHNIWQYDLPKDLWIQHQYNSSLNSLSSNSNFNNKKRTELATYLTHNLSGDVFVGLDSGSVKFLSNDSWHYISMPENVPITNMQVVTYNSNIYVGNDLGNVWYYDNQNGGVWNNISDMADYTPNGSITQVVVDDKILPNYVAVTNDGGDLWVYSILDQRWLNVTQYATGMGLYPDHGSPITTLQLYFLDSGYVYGYVGNQEGNVWRVIINKNKYTESRIDNIIKDVNFEGYDDIGSAITAMVVDGENNLYIGNESGHVWFINFSKHKWINLTKDATFAGGKSQITSLILNPQQKHSIFVANQDGYVGYYQMLDY